MLLKNMYMCTVFNIRVIGWILEQIQNFKYIKYTCTADLSEVVTFAYKKSEFISQ